MTVDEIIDKFVDRLNKAGSAIDPLKESPWITAWETKTGFTLPPSFRSLVTRYTFAPIEFDSMELLGNTGAEDEDEMTVVTLKDKTLSEPALKAGYLHFARISPGQYDPICFNMKSKGKGGEAPIVQLDHEALLQHSKIVVKESIETSFRVFAEKIIHG